MKCPSCGYSNPDEASSCQICGHSLTSSEPYRPTEKQTEPSGVGGLEPDSIFAGRYQVVRQLGQGGMGEVYLVRDQKMEGRELALKLISASLIKDDQARQRFIKEVEAAQRLKHENIVSVYHLDEVEGRDFFTMEHVPGRSLRELISDRKEAGSTFSLQEACSVLLPVLSALSHAHGQGIIHRDLKPENVVVNGDDLSQAEVKVLDFGLARIMSPSRMTTSAVAMGTAYYMSPEQLKGEEVDVRSDLFAAGAILYEVLTGEIPTGRFKLPSRLVSDLPEDLDHVVDIALATEKKERYGSAQEMLRALEQVPELDEVEVQPLEEETSASSQESAAEPKEQKVPEKPQPVESSRAPPGGAKAAPTVSGDKQGLLNRKSAIFGALLVLAAIVVFAGIRLSATGDGSSQESSAPEKKYALTVNTQPSVADVEIVNSDLEYRRGIELEPGRYHLRATYSGYEPAEKWVSIDNSDETVRMTLEERTYALTVDTEPESADVEFVNRDVNYRRGIELEPGRYQIRISELGYETKETWLSLDESDKRVSYTLQEKGPPPLERSEVVLLSDLGDDRIREVLQKAGVSMDAYSGDQYRRMRKAIEAFQKKNDLTVDGKLGPNTWSEMKKLAGLNSEKAQQSQELQNVKQKAQKYSEKLRKIQKSAMEENPELKKKRDELKALQEEKMNEIVPDDASRMEKLKARMKLREDKELQEKRQSLQKDFLEAMKKEDPKTQEYLDKFSNARKKIEEIKKQQ